MICLNNHVFPESDLGAIELEDQGVLCGDCVDELLTLWIPDADPNKANNRKPTMKGIFTHNYGLKAEKIA